MWAWWDHENTSAVPRKARETEHSTIFKLPRLQLFRRRWSGRHVIPVINAPGVCGLGLGGRLSMDRRTQLYKLWMWSDIRWSHWHCRIRLEPSCGRSPVLVGVVLCTPRLLGFRPVRQKEQSVPHPPWEKLSWDASLHPACMQPAGLNLDWQLFQMGGRRVCIPRHMGSRHIPNHWVDSSWGRTWGRQTHAMHIVIWARKPEKTWCRWSRPTTTFRH